METTVATRTFVIDNDFSYSPESGLRFERRFTNDDTSPYDMFEYELRTSVIREPSGQVIFEMKEVEVPKTWSQVATDILAQKYFRKAGVPQYDADGAPKLDADGKPVLGSEKSVKQVAHRLAGTWRYWAEKYGYFATAQDAQIFYDELVYMIIAQMVAPNSPQWFNTGLYWAYGINGPAQGHYYADPVTGEVRVSEDAYTHPQPHACFIQSIKDDLVNPGGIMDLWVREARLFKYGSGTGTNFSTLRGQGERLSGGGTSSGLMSWLKIGDRAAGAIKSGGTTRRAAKMVIINVDHPDIEKFVEWKVNEEKKVAALLAAGYDSAYEGEAYSTVSGQNSNNSVRVTQDFMEAVQNDSDWNLIWRTDGRVGETIKSRSLWDKIANAAWSCADPGLQYDTTINEWHTCPASGRINASNPCSEYMFLDDTACNLASINLGHFYDADSFTFNVEGFKYVTRIWTVVLEVSILMAQYPSEELAQNSYLFRSLGLGYANIGSLLMTAGIPYDSPEALGFAGAVTALMTAESYAASAEMASFLGAFSHYPENKEDMLRVIRNHRRASFGVPEDEYEKLDIKPMALNPAYVPAYLLSAVHDSWDRAMALGEEFGYRNAQVTCLAPTGTIGLLMDCATTGVEPDFALVKFKKLAGGGYFKIVNESVPVALRVLGYAEQQVGDIINYLRGGGTLMGAPHINHQSLKEKGLSDGELEKIEKALPKAFELQFVLNVWTLGEECLTRLGYTSEQYNDPNFNLLTALGFTNEQIASANEYVCGAMTIEGAPHLRKEHYAVFDTANKNGKKGQRYIHYLGHIRMMAAVQPFLSGAISKTINMPNEATIDDVKTAYVASWKLGLKAIALYRDGCKLSQPLSAKSQKKEEKKVEEKIKEEIVVPPVAAQLTVSEAKKEEPVHANGNGVKKYTLSTPNEEVVNQMVEDGRAVVKYAHDGTSEGAHIYVHGEQRKLPYKRGGVTIKTMITGQALFLRTGEYPDGKLGEIFIDMHKEGASFRSLLNLFAISISIGLQYGVPLEQYVSKFTFTRFEPSGMTDHPNIKFCTSIIDFIFRVLGMEYLGRMDFVQVKPEGIQKNRAEQIAKVIEEAQGQTAIPLDNVEKTDGQASLPSIPKAQMTVEEESSGTDAMGKHLSGMMGDAPPCPTCGHITIRSGSCYKCLNCGSSTGCS
jgi:ribonucleoside-diphosphate reductase alpha chain